MTSFSAPIMNPAVSYARVVENDPRTNGSIKDADYGKMKDAAQSFEAQYVFQLLELMAPEIGKDGLNGAGFAEENFRPQLHEAIAEKVVKNGGFGLANNVLRELVATQEAANRGGSKPAASATAARASAAAAAQAFQSANPVK